MNIFLDMDDRTLNLINVTHHQQILNGTPFFADLNTFLSSTYDNIIGGDFNCILNTRLDKLGENPCARQYVTVCLNALNMQYRMIDIRRRRHKDERNFTWTGRNPADVSSFIRTRNDYFFYLSVHESVYDGSRNSTSSAHGSRLCNIG